MNSLRFTLNYHLNIKRWTELCVFGMPESTSGQYRTGQLAAFLRPWMMVFLNGIKLWTCTLKFSIPYWTDVCFFSSYNPPLSLFLSNLSWLDFQGDLQETTSSLASAPAGNSGQARGPSRRQWWKTACYVSSYHNKVGIMWT